uniref:Metallo-beta-lactamase domain-containing protein n=1 Tax=Thermogemmatispora argillosa TaxID=2045280 RepID=A0A455T1C5_9CHLR|nr:hypothetical protein KTA_25360 [Thermogemmatispora argillosa]
MSYLMLLGTGTCQIELERRASSVLLHLAGLPILFDCGRGISQRLVEVGLNPNALEHIVISHFHPDHVSDLIPLLHAGAWSRRQPRKQDLHLYGPPGLQRLIDGLMRLFSPHSFRQPHYQIQVHEITEETCQIGPYSFDFIELPPAGNHGLRFTWHGQRYAITGDSSFHEQERLFLEGVDLAIIDSGHLSDDEIVQLAAATGVKTLVCSHLYRELDAARLQERARAEGYRGSIIVGRDLMTFALPDE